MKASYLRNTSSCFILLAFLLLIASAAEAQPYGPRYYPDGPYYNNYGCFYDYYGVYTCPPRYYRPYYRPYYEPYYGPSAYYGGGFPFFPFFAAAAFSSRPYSHHRYYGGYRGGYRGYHGGGWHHRR